MLGRKVGAKYHSAPYQLLSDEVRSELAKADACVANLESPVTRDGEDDSLKFCGNHLTLNQFDWVSCFSLSNNHINDFGPNGMMDTLDALDNAGIPSNGLFKEKYSPFTIERSGEKVAIVTCTDMMNIEFGEDCPFKTLRVNEPDDVSRHIHESKEQGFFTILYAHIGMLFSRFPNPSSLDFIHKMIDEGADCVVTAHSHCLGCHEVYKGVHIFHSLGDFLMDGSSFRRRTAGILELSVDNGQLVDWKLVPVCTNMNLVVELPNQTTAKKILDKFLANSDLLCSSRKDYKAFFKKWYRRDMIAHSLSTLRFEFETRGLKGFFHILRVRFRDVLGMIKRVFTDRSSMAYDTDGVDPDHKLSNKDII